MKKNFINLAMAALVAFGTVAYTGCGKKGCMTETDDSYDATATEADPDACDPTATVSKFVGTFAGTETCASGTDAYTITITSSSNEYTILVKNLYDAGTDFTLTASVSQGEITIANQTVSGATVSGSGELSGSTLTINYTITVGVNSDTCTVTATKQ